MKKTKKIAKKIPQKKIGVKKSKVANRPKCVLPKFRGDPSEVPNRPNRSTRSSDQKTTKNFKRPKTFKNCLRFANPAEATTNSTNIAPIAAKLRQNAFQTICNFRFFDAENFFSNFFFGFFGFGHRFFVIFDRFWRIWAFLDVKIKLLDGFCFRFVILSGLYDIWSPFSRPKTKITLINPPTPARPQATGRGRGGVNPPQGRGGKNALKDLCF